MSATGATTRIGGHAVAESLRALGADVVFGLPGVHALPMWEGLRATDIRVVGFRQELNAAFAADGYARLTGRPAPLLVSTGPGAFMTLAPLMEAFTAFVPVVVVSSQIRSDAIGGGRGELHETPDQAASFAPLVKWTARANTTDEIPHVLAEAWRCAATAPAGPVYVEVPYDVLRREAGPVVDELDGEPSSLPLPPDGELDRAAAVLAGAKSPLLVAGGGCVRSRAGEELLALATRLDAPVATTYTGKGAFPEHHPLALGSAWDDAVYRELVAGSDVVLVVGSWLGYEFADAFRGFGGTVIQVDAEPDRIGATVASLGVIGDAKATLRALLERTPDDAETGGERRAAAVRERVAATLREPANRPTAELLEIVDAALPANAVATWDSTILAYAAAWYLRADEPRRFLYPAGSSTLGYAWPAALGAATAAAPVLAVVGDGGFQYGVAELATAKEHALDVALLVVDDGGYGILREYQGEAGFSRVGVDLERPDLVALCEAFAVPARQATVESVGDDLHRALETSGPAVVVLETLLTMPQPGT